MSLAREKPNGNRRSPSQFLEWLPSALRDEIDQPATLPLPPEASRPTPIEIRRGSEWSITDSRLRAYEKCPQRFFYTHVIELGKAKKRTTFSQTQDCLYELLRWLASARCTKEPTLTEVENQFEAIWQANGPVEHSFRDDYRRLASRLISASSRAGAGRRFRETEPLAINFPNGRVLVEPNELAELPDGTAVLRRIRTGSKRTNEYDGLEYALYQIAAETRIGKDAVVEALHLTDERGAPDRVTISPRKLDNRRSRTNDMLGQIAAGWFPAKPDTITCPRCPHFFICDARPRGPLSLP